MYFPINNVWCLIWNITEMTSFSLGLNIPWLFGKCISSKGRQLTKEEIRQNYIPK